MPTTENGAPYPSPTDPNDIPGDLQALAEWSDEKLGTQAAVNDAVMTAAANDSESGFAGALATSIADAVPVVGGQFFQRRYRKARVVALEDSLGQDPSGYFPVTAALSGQRLENVANQGMGGQPTSALLARVDAALAVDADVILVGGPTNDFGGGVPESTIRANFAAIDAAILAGGREVLHRTCPPRDGAGPAPYDTLAKMRAAIQRSNAWMVDYCARNGYPLLDIYTPLVDPATGGYLSGLTDDGVHPNGVGVLAVARYLNLVGNLPQRFSGALPRPLATANVSGGDNLITNALFATNTAGVADGFTASGTFTTKEIVTDSGVKWQHLVGSTNTTLDAVVMGCTPGHVYDFAVLGACAAGSLTVRVDFLKSDYSLIGTHNYPVQDNYALTTLADHAVYSVPPLVAPALTDRIQVLVVTANAAFDVYIARPILRDLTALGLAA